MRILLLLCLLFAVPAVPLQAQAQTQTQTSSPVIAVLGDSISAAYGIEESEGWVSLMENELQTSNPDIKVVNASITGDTTDGGLQRLPALLQRVTPDLVIIELGGNDGLRGQSLKLMKRNLLAMVGLIRQAGAEALILGMRIPSNYGAYFTERFFNVYQSVADESNTALLPFVLAPVATDISYFQKDGVHPTAEAQPLIMEPVLAEVKALLASLTVAQ